MNVLSLFDGMSCAQIALHRAKIPVENYFASEVDKYAIKIALKNYPGTIQLGNILDLRYEKLPKIDLLIGGSPCQGFSSAGKGLNFDDPRSKLFFGFVRILKEIKPKYFILENVRMKNSWRDIISEFIGLEPIEINSALVSGQNRRRFYWTNITGIKQPEDKNIFLHDILIDGVTDRKKSTVVLTNTKGTSVKGYFQHRGHQAIFKTAEDIQKLAKSQGNKIMNIYAKCPAILAGSHGYALGWIESPGGCWRKLHPVECERLQTVPDDYTEGVSNTQRYKMLGNGFTVDVIAHILSFIKEF